MSFKVLSDEELINTYFKAKQLKLNDSFLRLLYNEIVIRGLLTETILRS
jgi:hypothetical protein